MRFGFHISIAGGFSKVVERAKRLDCETIQVFSSNPRGWKNKRVVLKEVKKFKEDILKEDIFPVFVHLPYLPNLTSPDKKIHLRSIKSLYEELKRTKILGAEYLVIHPGARKYIPERCALNKISDSINLCLDKVKNNVMILVENSSGEGSEVGYSFKHIRKIIDGVEEKGRIGVCLDTAHLFQGGYNISDKKELDRILDEFDNMIGLNRLKLIHLNDSKTEPGSRIDRHWHIGKGCIGKDGFKNIINHPKLLHLPAIMETPKESDRDDIMNMREIRKLIKKPKI